jgi:hypothetical protein
MTVLLFDLITSFLKASALSKSSWYWARNWSILLFRRGFEVERGLGGIVVVGLVEGFLERVEREYIVEVRVQDEESLLRRNGAFYTGQRCFLLDLETTHDFTRFRSFLTLK